MRKWMQLLVMLAIVALPFALTSCDDDEPWGYYHPDYPDGGYDRDDELEDMVSLLCNEWYGDMYYTYTDDGKGDSNGHRVTETYKVSMKFFQYGNSKNTYAGQGIEVDTNERGDTQTLIFSWWIDTKRGDIYVKYTDSKTIFKMDALSKEYGYYLGWEAACNAFTFYGYLMGQSNDDVIYIDLERVTTEAKPNVGAESLLVPSRAFGKAENNVASQLRVNAIPRLHKR